MALEQAERLRAEERAALAARIHDGVLQTLALIQRDQNDGTKVAALARRQERELRSVLYGSGAGSAGGFREALTLVAGEVEELTGIRVQVVLVGDRAAGDVVDAAVLAAREALMNAAKHAGIDEVSLYGEAGEEALAIFVRDRGVGFDPADVPADRHGVAQSIVGRMESAGGRVEVRSSDRGTEVRIMFGDTG